MLASGRLPGAMELAVPGEALNQAIEESKKAPVPSAITLQPKAFATVCVQETAMPSPSITEKWVVP